MQKATSIIADGTLSSPHPYIAQTIEEQYWFHRSNWMETVLKETLEFFNSLFGPAYTTIVVTSAREGAKEMLISNLSSTDTSVYADDADAWRMITLRMGVPTTSSLRKKSQRPLALLTAQNERVLRQVRDIRAQMPHAKVCIDLTDIFGILNVSFDKLNADAYVISPEKGLGSIVGCSLIILKTDLLKEVESLRQTMPEAPYSFDILRYEKAMLKNTTPYSPDISALIGLHASLLLLEKNSGLPGLVKRHASYARAVQIAAKKWGFTIAESCSLFTEIKLNSAKDVTKVLTALRKKRIFLGKGAGKDAVRIVHTGWIEGKTFSVLLNTLGRVLGKDTSDLFLPSLIHTPSYWALSGFPGFEIHPSEFIHQARFVAEKTYEKKADLDFIVSSANSLFQTPISYEVTHCYTDRIVGFIGAGKTVRETVSRLTALGVKKCIVFSPSLAKDKKSGDMGDAADWHSVSYWERRGVTVALSAREVFLTAHTVVLLPTLYDTRALSLFNKSAEYRNDRCINNALLKEIRDKGKMDLLINASAREELIERKSLAAHVQEGWLRFISDELPPPTDPLLRKPGVLMTGHIGGSSTLTKKRIALNTRSLLKNLLSKEPTYDVIPFTNKHLKPKSGWRPSPNNKETIRILLTDIFDKKTLHLERLGSEMGLNIAIHDMSEEMPTLENMQRVCSSFKPHIIMLRTRTIVDARMARFLATIPTLHALIRPGVGLDNVYGGFRTLSAAGIRIFNEPTGNSFSVGEMTSHFILNGTPKVMLAPGPTNMNRNVFSVFDEYTSAKDPAFLRACANTKKMLLPWMRLRNHGALFFHATPSTGFLEAAIVNLSSHGDHGVVVEHGKFGSRFVQISEAKKRIPHVLETKDTAWGKAHSPADIKYFFKTLNERGIVPSFLCLQQHETSAGVAYTTKHLDTIVKMARMHNKNIMIIVDGVSATGADDIAYKNLDIDALIVGSQKAIGVSSGISFMSLSKRAIHFMEQRDNNAQKNTGTYYYDLLRLARSAEAEEALSPNMFHILSTHKSLSILNKDGGYSAVTKKHRIFAKKTRSFASKLRLRLLTQQGFRSNAVTALLLPKGIDASILRKELERQYGIFVAGAQSDILKPRLIRIGHLGHVSERELLRCFRGLSVLLKNRP